MRLATIMVGGVPTAVLVMEDDRILDIAAATAAAGDNTDLPLAETGLQALIEAGPGALDALRALQASAMAGELDVAIHPAAGLAFLAPLPAPRKNVFCVGRNYAAHIAEGEKAQNTSIGISEHPVFFTKPLTAVIGPGAEIPLFPHVSTAIDYEVELAVVIGKAGRDIPKDRALSHVFGYTVLNDITARDLQRRHGGQYFKGKGLDGSCPIGPWIVTADALGDPQALALRSWVNGELRQEDTTASMIFDIPTLIASLSEGMTLEPGDILATGTPSGVGYAMDPPNYLEDGDTVACEVAGIGRLENPVRAI